MTPNSRPALRADTTPSPTAPDDHYLKRELYDYVRNDPMIFDFLQDGSLDGLWYWDLERPEHEWMSPQFWRTLGYDPSDKPHLAAAWQDIIHPDDRELALANFTAHCADPSRLYDQIVRYRHKAGHTVWVRCRGLAIRDARGQPIRMLGAHTDVTLLKQAEFELRHKNQQLETSNEELAQFAYAASHDLQAPIRTLTGLLEILRLEHAASMDAEGQHVLKLALEAATRAQTLTEGILQYSRLTNAAPEVSAIDSQALIGQIAQDLANDIEAAGATLCYTGLPRVQAIATPLRQLLQNLISNAIKFRRPGVAPRVQISAEDQGECWQFAVSDNGIGIAPEHQDKLFVLFRRLHNRTRYQGNGLGLALCRRVVHMHGGHIWLESDPEQGTTFFFTLRKELHRG